MSIEILGILVVPGKLIIGICFPQHEVDNKYPHMTLMLNEWPAKKSNDVMEACFDDKRPLAAIYDDLRNVGRVKSGDEIKKVNIKVRGEQTSNTCYFISLMEPIVFNGVTKRYY